jgi:hypothetical protein
MTTIDRETLLELAKHQTWPSITILLPTHRAGAEKEQDRIRLRNLIRSAVERLVRAGSREVDAEATCERLAALAEDETFWRKTEDGLAIFLSGDVFMPLVTGVRLPERVVVGDRFHLRTLLAHDPGPRPFFALAVDRNGCRLFRGDRDAITPVELEGVPDSLADELRYDETQDGLQYASVPAPAQAAGGGRPTGAVFHGHGGEKDVDKTNLERYLRKIEAAVTHAVARDPDTPLVLLGVDYALAIYRSLNTCPELADEQVTGATDELSPHEIRERAAEALEPRFAAIVQTRVEELEARSGSSLAAHDPVSTLAAAAGGRVRTLFATDGNGPFGIFDRTTFRVHDVSTSEPSVLCASRTTLTGDQAGSCGWDLVDLAVAETLLHGGDIHGLASESIDVQGVAALLRY